MVKKEVDHFPCISKNSKEPKGGRGARASSQCIESCEKPAGSKSLPAKARGNFPLLGSLSNFWVFSLNMPVDKLRDILEGLNKLVNAISLC